MWEGVGVGYTGDLFLYLPWSGRLIQSQSRDGQEVMAGERKKSRFGTERIKKEEKSAQ